MDFNHAERRYFDECHPRSRQSKRRTLSGFAGCMRLEAASSELARLRGVRTQVLVVTLHISLIVAVVELLCALELRLLIELALILVASYPELASKCRLILIAECRLTSKAAWLCGVRTQVLVMSRLVAAIVGCLVRRRRLERVVRLRLVLAIHRLHEASWLIRSLYSLVLGYDRRTERAGSKRSPANTEACRLLGIRTQVLVMPRLVAAIVGCLVRLLVIQS